MVDSEKNFWEKDKQEIIDSVLGGGRYYNARSQHFFIENKEQQDKLISFIKEILPKLEIKDSIIKNTQFPTLARLEADSSTDYEARSRYHYHKFDRYTAGYERTVFIESLELDYRTNVMSVPSNLCVDSKDNSVERYKNELLKEM